MSRTGLLSEERYHGKPMRMPDGRYMVVWARTPWVMLVGRGEPAHGVGLHMLELLSKYERQPWQPWRMPIEYWGVEFVDVTPGRRGVLGWVFAVWALWHLARRP